MKNRWIVPLLLCLSLVALAIVTSSCQHAGPRAVPVLPEDPPKKSPTPNSDVPPPVPPHGASDVATDN